VRALVIALVFIAAPAQAAVPLCLEVRADDAGFQQLVEDELRHHPTHRLATGDCGSRLTVELFASGGARYLTVRVNQEVPVRFTVKREARDVEEKLSEALRQVLQHDPVYLAEDLSRMNAVWRSGSNLVKNGRNRYRLELIEVIGNGGRNAVFATGGAFTVARGIDHLQIFARLEAAGSPKSYGDGGVVLRALAGADVGLLWETSARANNSFYLGPGVGLHFLQFEGQDAPPVGSLLFSLSLRAGVRCLRFYGFDVDLFAQLQLPFYKTADPDSPLVDAYTPFLTTGLGVGF
jgi:hypothetical protein